MRLSHDRSSVACTGLKVKVMGQAIAVGPISIEGSFFQFSSRICTIELLRMYSFLPKTKLSFVANKVCMHVGQD